MDKLRSIVSEITKLRKELEAKKSTTITKKEVVENIINLQK